MARDLMRVFVSDKLEHSRVFALPQASAYYLTTVLRKHVGDALLIFNGNDGEWEAIITDIKKKQLMITCSKQVRAQPQRSSRLHLCFAPIKNGHSNMIIQKATELGVDSIIPILTERTIMRDLNINKAHLIAIEAAEQSNRVDVPRIEPMLDLYDIPMAKYSLVIFCDEDEREMSMLMRIDDIKNSPDVLVIVGPEGGFAEKERVWLKSLLNTKSVSLGFLKLRSETAAIAALSIVSLALTQTL